MKFEMLEQYGIDYKKGIERCMDSEELYEKILGIFVSGDHIARSQTALDSGVYSDFFERIHELKGACGNASMTQLYDSVCVLVDKLRTDQKLDGETAQLFEKLKEQYYIVCEGIGLAKE